MIGIAFHNIVRLERERERKRERERELERAITLHTTTFSSHTH